MNQCSWPRSFDVIIEGFPANMFEMAGQADLVNGDSHASGVSEEAGLLEAAQPPQRILPNTQPCPDTSLYGP